MDRDNPTPSTNELIAALADGELDLREYPNALAQIAQDPQAAQRIACLQQLRDACAKAMDGPESKCPGDLAASLRAIADGSVEPAAAPALPAAVTPANPARAAYDGPPVAARIGRWLPTAVAAVMLIAAGVLFMNANNGVGPVGPTASMLTVDQISSFTGRHDECSVDPGVLEQAEQFGDVTEFERLPGRLSSYFQTSTDGMHLSLDGMGYEYELAGACNLPGAGAVHIVYRDQDEPSKAISLWVMPAEEDHEALEPDHVYSEAGSDPSQEVIYWRDGGLLYFLVGDSPEDCRQAVRRFRETA